MGVHLSTMPLTPTQQHILSFVRDYLARNAFPPSLREIQVAMGFASVNAIVKHLRRLEAAGVIEVPARTARGIRLVGVEPSTNRNTLRLPLIGKVAAGAPILVEAHIEQYLHVDRALFKPRADYFLRVQGESMVDAGIFDRDLIAVQKTPDARNGQIVVARVDGAVTVKVLERMSRTLRLLPRNPAFQSIEIDASHEFAIEGIYCGLLRVA